jgi:hypothetical protein
MLSFVGFLATAGSTRADDSRAAEVQRIRIHFDSVLAELPGRDVSALSATQRERRSALFSTLRAYRDRGDFPRNYDFPEAPTPYFVDRRTGIVCAVGHLIESTGRRDIVDRVAATNNNVYVAELAGDTAFTAWLDAHGLTLAEAAWIQVPYVDDPLADRPIDGPGDVVSRRSLDGYLAVSIGGAAVAALLNSQFNSTGSSRAGSIAGFASGLLAVGVGAAGYGQENGSAALSTGSILVGATSLWFSSRGIMRHRMAEAQAREAARVSVAPLIPIGADQGTGISVSLRF